jgi:hypothetical protein
VNTEELTAALILEEGDNDLLVYCMSDSATYIYCMSGSATHVYCMGGGATYIYCMSNNATYICKKRYDEGYYSSLIGTYLMDSEMKFAEFYRVSRDVFHFILK